MKARFLIPFILGMASSHAMQQPFELTKLPADCVTVVAANVPAKTRAIAVKKIRALSLACARLLIALNDKNSIRYIVHRLAERFRTDPQTIAVTLNSPGARLWLAMHLTEIEDYQSFEALQKMLMLLEALKKEALEKGRLHTTDDEPLRTRDDKVYTKRGFYLSIREEAPLPCQFHTPWGTLKPLGLTAKCQLERIFFTQEFFKKLKVKFRGFSDGPSHYYPSHYYLVQPLNRAEFEHLNDDEKNNYLKMRMQEIPQKTIDDYAGTECFLMSTTGSTAWYELNYIDGQEVAPLRLFSRNDSSQRDEKVLEKIFLLLQDRYNNRRLEPTTTLSLPARAGNSSQVIHNPCSTCGQGNCFIYCPLCPAKATRYCSLECQQADWQHHVTQRHQEMPNIQNAVSECIALLANLKEQPPQILRFKPMGQFLFSDMEPTPCTYAVKKISGKGTELEYELCEILGESAKYIVGAERYWHIHHEDLESARGELKEGQDELTLSDDSRAPACPLGSLRTAFKAIIAECSQGWIPVRKESYPKLQLKENSNIEDPDDCELYIKYFVRDISEPRTIRLLARKYGFENKIDIGFGLKGEDAYLYLFIKNDAVDAFKAVFDIKSNASVPLAETRNYSPAIKQAIAYLGDKRTATSETIVDEVKPLLAKQLNPSEWALQLHRCAQAAGMPILAAIIELHLLGELNVDPAKDSGCCCS